MLPKWTGYAKMKCIRPVNSSESPRRCTGANDFDTSHSYGIAGAASIANSAGTMCILSVLGPYVILAAQGKAEALNVQRLFTIVTTLNLVQQPLNFIGVFPAVQPCRR